MALGRSGVPQLFDRSDSGAATDLFVAMQVWDIAGPTLIATIPMPHLVNGSYYGLFTPLPGINYAINTMCYTDNTYSTPLPDTPPGSATLYAEKNIWDELLSDHVIPGSAGQQLAAAASGGGGGGGGGGVPTAQFVQPNQVIAQMVQPPILTADFILV